MNPEGHWHWPWWLMTMACVLWYTVITGYGAVKGAVDIKHILARVSGKERPSDAYPHEPGRSFRRGGERYPRRS